MLYKSYLARGYLQFLGQRARQEKADNDSPEWKVAR
jgi:hypothetical protein